MSCGVPVLTVCTGTPGSRSSGVRPKIGAAISGAYSARNAGVIWNMPTSATPLRPLAE